MKNNCGNYERTRSTPQKSTGMKTESGTAVDYVMYGILSAAHVFLYSVPPY